MTLDDAWQWLALFTNLEKTPSSTMRTWRLDRMHALLAERGHPERNNLTLHVAGSKGKGTTATYLSSLLTSLGHPAGLYTSPHVSDWRERITRNGWWFDEAVYSDEVQRLSDFWSSSTDFSRTFEHNWGGPPTTFEWLTLAAFEIFRDEDLPARVLETGLGGRLDATNAQTPMATVLTLIELEHTEILGSTRAAIAGEKAGIMKPGVAAFVAPQTDEALTVFRETAQRVGAPLHEFSHEVVRWDADLARDGTSLTVEFADGANYSARLPLLGRATALSASIALWTVHRLCAEGTLKTAADVGDALVWGLESAQLPGRMQVVRTDPWTVLDGAHTEASVALLVESWIPLFGRGGTVIFGAFDGKAIEPMARALAPVFDQVIVTSPGSFRPSNLPAVRDAFIKAGTNADNTVIVEDPAAAYQRAAERGRPVLVCGSFYLVGRFLTEMSF